MQKRSGRVFGSLHPFIEDGPMLGRIVANEGFFSALLDLDPFEDYEFFLHNPKSFREAIDAAAFPAVRRGAVHVLPQQALVKALQEKPFHCFHLADPLCAQTSLAYARNRLAPAIFPITSVPHTLSYHVYVQDFLQQIWPGTSPRDIICATSRAAVDVLATYYATLKENYRLPETFRAPGLRLIPLGVDTVHFSPPDTKKRAQAREKFGLAPETIALLAHGRLAVDDKMDLLPLLYALARVQRETDAPQCTLVLSGKRRDNDSYPEVLCKSAEALAIPLLFRPDPDSNTLSDLYAAADIYVSPSDNLQETFGLTLLEAASSGLPVIASDWDGYRDLVSDGETGFLIPTLTPAETPYLDVLCQILPENVHQLLRAEETVVDVAALARAIVRLAKDAALRTRMGEKGRQRVLSSFGWKTCVERWLNLIDELWAIPIEPEEETRIREAEHPSFLSFSRLFAGHPSKQLGKEVLADMRITLSQRGMDFLHKKAIAVTWNALDLLHENAALEKILVLARKGVSFSELSSRMRDLPSEKLSFTVFWALKHDLLDLLP